MKIRYDAEKVIKGRVSVIMSAFNEERNLDISIQSILAQEYPDWELIICDDASTDNTQKIIKKYSEVDSRIKLLSNEVNRGLAYSLNFCISESTGEYIARQDADDKSYPNRISKQINALKENPKFSFIGSSVDYYNDFGVWGKNNSIKFPTKQNLIKGSPFAHPTIVFRTKSIADVGGYRVSKETFRSQDYDLWFRMYAQNLIGFNLDESTVQYRLDNNSYKKRKFKYRVNEAIIRYKGYKLINVKWFNYFYVLKPIILGLIPVRVLQLRDRIRKLDKNRS